MGIVGKPIVAKLSKKFQVRQFATEQLETGAIITPITNVDNLVIDTKILSAIVAVSTPGTVYTSHVVPLGKRWRIVAINIYVASGTFTFDQFVIGTPTAQVPIYRQTAAATLTTQTTTDIKLTEGQFIGFNVPAVTGAGNANATLMYEEEDAY